MAAVLFVTLRWALPAVTAKDYARTLAFGGLRHRKSRDFRSGGSDFEVFGGKTLNCEVVCEPCVKQISFR